MSAGAAIRSAGLGLCWGGIAALLGGRAIGSDVWGGVIATPVIGLLVGRASLAPFQDGSGRRRVAIALAGLVGGATLFGLAVGVTDLVRHPHQLVFETLMESVAGVLWGVFATGFFLVLWPLSYATYWLLTWLD